MQTTPRYLADYADTWIKDPRRANLEWFRNAKWGLFLHYGLYSQLGRGEWAMLREQIPIAEYEKLFDTFNPANFDADFITDLALESKMSYVNLTTCHHEGFCLYRSDTEAYNSYSACKRDLVRELAEQCDRKGLGFFAYYTHVFNWRHPYAFPGNVVVSGQPPYEHTEPRYLYKSEADIAKYWSYAHACMKELLQLEHPLAGIWLDIIIAYKHPDVIRIEDTYRLIREMRPDILLSFKQGATGEEDFASPEFSFNSMGNRLRAAGLPEAADIADRAWEINRHKHNEICMTLQREAWGYKADAVHYNAEEVRTRLAYALMNNCNMLANTGPLADGSLHPDDVATLREVGRTIREQGWPGPDEAITPDSWHARKSNAHAGAQ